jgi:uncharacterized membrane protein YfcA
MELWEAIGLLAAAFVAGAINAVAGGGSLISFPALIAAGYPAKTANVTNTVALWPGYVGGSLGYREELRNQRTRLLAMLLPNVAGALLGSIILLATPQSAFDIIVPFLILFACGLMAFQEPLASFAERHRLGSSSLTHVPPPMLLATFLLAIYGAYFGAALGIMTLAVLTVLMPDDIHRSNALKGMNSLLINAVAVLWFGIFGPVRWGPAAVMAVGAVLGGYLGVGLARRLGRQWLRLTVIAYGTVVAIVLFVQLFA